MGDILEEASSLVECKECPWYRACVTPMKIGSDDLMREIRQMQPGGSINQAGEMEFRNLMANMASIAQNVFLEGCPIFVKRLKSSPKLVGQLKRIMQNWGAEDEESNT